MSNWVLAPSSEPRYVLPPPEEQHLGQLAPPSWPAPGFVQGLFAGLGLYDVTFFGATGNGVTDDSTAIQAAVTAASTGGGVVWFPAGNYVVSVTIQVADVAGLWLTGTGWGSRITWTGANSTPVFRLTGWSGGGISGLWITGQPGVAANKATAAIELASTAGHVNYGNTLRNLQLGPSPAQTQSITFAAGILFSGAVNNDLQAFQNIRIAYCDTGVNIASGQNIDNTFDTIRVIGCGTGFTIKATVHLRSVEFSNSTTTDIDVSNAALVTAQQVTSEGAVRFLTIAGQSHFTLRGGYFMASGNITAGGDFIKGNDSAQDQVVTLEDWQLTYVGGYGGPTPLISVRPPNAGSGAKVLNLNRVRGIGTAFTESNLDVVPPSASQQVIVAGQVYDGTSNVYREFQNVLASGGTVCVQRYDWPAGMTLYVGNTQIVVP